MADTIKVKNAITQHSTVGGITEGLAQNIAKSAASSVSPLNNLGKYLTGTRAIVKVNDKIFGFAFGVTININTEYVENATIDSPIAYELMPTRLTVNGTLSMFHIPGRGPSKRLVQSNAVSYLMHKYIGIEIMDQTTGQIIFKTNKAVVTNRSQTINAGEISNIQLHWKALGFVDDLTNPTLPSGADGSLFTFP
jgi:hypothetical protein